MKQLPLFAFLAALFLLNGCGKPGGGPGMNGGKDQSAESAVPVMVETVQPRDLYEYIEVTGRLEGITDIVMSSETAGRITAVFKKLGDWVNQGETLGEIENENYRIQLEQAEAAGLSAEAAFEVAELQMKTAESLFAREQISNSEYVQAKSSYKSAQAGLSGARAAMELARKQYDNSRFVAPVSGYIADLGLEVGETISSGQAVCSIVSSKKLIIKTGVGQSQITRLRPGQSVSVRYEDLAETFEGKIRGIGIKPLTDTGNYPLEIELNNSQGKLLPGMIVEARILSYVYNDVFYTSLNNIKEEYDQSVVFTADDDNRARKKTVVIGKTIGNNAVITQGLAAGMRLVTDGIDNLVDGSDVKIRH